MASAAEGLTDRRWREGLEQLRAKRAAAWDRWARGWAQCLLLCTCLYLFIGASPFPHQQLVDPETGGMVMSPINRYVWILLLLLSLPLLWVRRRALLPALRRLPLLNAVMLWFWMTTFWALDPGTAGRRLFLYTVIVFIALATSLGFNSGRRLHRGFAVACGAMVLIDLLCWIVAPTLSMTPLGLAAIHTHKNVLGGVMLFSCLMLSTFALSQKTWAGRFGWGAIFLLALLLLVASQSKTSLFIFIVVVTSAPLVVALGRAEVGVSFALAAMVGGMICVNLLAWLALCTLDGSDPLAPVRGVTFTQRTDVWGFVIAEIQKRPLLGSGFGSFWDIDARVQPSLQSGLWFAQPDAYTNQAHNGYLDLLVTTGAVGLIGALGLLFRWIVCGAQLLRGALRPIAGVRTDGVGAGLALGLFPLIIAFHNFMESSLFTANSVFGALVLIIGVDLELRAAAARSGAAGAG
jgi:O-antigen ligase